MMYSGNILKLLILLIVFKAFNVVGKKRDDDSPIDSAARLAEGAAAVKSMPWGQYAVLPAKDLSTATQFGLKDVVKNKWLLRVDNAHKGAKSAHININPVLTKVRDPHLKIPNAIAPVLGAGGQVLNTIGNYAFGASVLIDGVRLTSDAVDDLSRTGSLGKKTVKTAASIGGGWAGGMGGGYVGQSIGGWIGGTVGAVFGGVGAVPGTAVGSLIGGLVGGIFGATTTSKIAEEII